MKWYYKVGGAHTRVDIYMNGALCGRLTFRNEEFQEITAVPHPLITFIKDEPLEEQI